VQLASLDPRDPRRPNVEKLYVNTLAKEQKKLINTVQSLHARGLGSRTIAEKLGIKRKLVRIFLDKEVVKDETHTPKSLGSTRADAS
jgi:hypothetical protein